MFRIRIHWFRIQIRHFRLSTNPDPDPGFWWQKIEKMQCGGSGMFIPDPGSDFFPSRIPDPNCLHPGSRIRIKEFKCFNQKKWFLSSRKYDPGCSSRIRSSKIVTYLWVLYPLASIRDVHFLSMLREKPSTLKREHPSLQNLKFLSFFLFLWVILSSWIRIHWHCWIRKTAAISKSCNQILFQNSKNNWLN